MSSNYTSTGSIVVINQTQQISEKFKKREFVISLPQDNPEYPPEVIKFEVVQDKCEILDSFQIGQEVEVGFNLKGRPWIDKQTQAVKGYFTTLQCWKINATSQQGPPPAPYQQAPPVQAPQPTMNFENGEDIPF